MLISGKHVARYAKCANAARQTAVYTKMRSDVVAGKHTAIRWLSYSNLVSHYEARKQALELIISIHK